MSNETPIACSLNAADRSARLAEMAAVGEVSLIESGAEGGEHQLRFRSDVDTRLRLGSIVAAEAECCSFLFLRLEDDADETILTIVAPGLGQPIADEIAAAFRGVVGSPEVA